MLAITIGGGLYAGCIVVNGRQQKRCALSGSRENAALANIFRCLTRQRFFFGPKFRALIGRGEGGKESSGRLTPPVWLTHGSHVCMPSKKAVLAFGTRHSALSAWHAMFINI